MTRSNRIGTLLTAALPLVFAAAVAPASAATTDAEAGADASVDRLSAGEVRRELTGTWYAQIFLGEALPEDAPLRMHVKPDGAYHLTGDALEQPLSGSYSVAGGGAVTLHAPADGEAGRSIVFPRAAKVGSALILAHRSGVTVLTRRPDAGPEPRALGKVSGMTQGFLDYADLNHDAFPPTLGALVAKGYIPPEITLAPDAGVDVPQGFHDWSNGRKAQWVNRHSSYIYVGGFGTLDADRVAMFEAPASDQRTISVAFADGHVEMMPVEEVNRKLEQQTGHSIEAWRTMRDAD